jgi:hypothetical protein
MSEADDKYDALASAGESALAHYGVPGMKWGHRKARALSGRISSGGPPKKRTPEEQAVRDRRVKIGKDVTKAVLIAAGTVAVGSVAGPLAAAGAGAVARTLASSDVFGTTTTTRTTTIDSYGNKYSSYDVKKN